MLGHPLHSRADPDAWENQASRTASKPHYILIPRAGRPICSGRPKYDGFRRRRAHTPIIARIVGS